MLKEYTFSQMEDLWRLRYGWLASPGVSGVTDMTRLRDLIRVEVDAWYERLLRTADPGLLPQEDVAAEVDVRPLRRNAALLTLPERAVRLTALRMAPWQVTLYDVPAVSDAAVARESVTALASTPFCPNACLCPDGRIEVYGLDRAPVWGSQRQPLQGGLRPEPEVAEALAVVRPGEGRYIFDTSLLYDFLNEKRQTVI